MFRAQHNAVAQNANMVLINIRTAEVRYFSRFFANFGIQSAIVFGAIISAVNQVPSQCLAYNCQYFFIFTYFITSAAALSMSCHVLVTTLMASAYGEGCALRGPLGSMVKCVEGMIIEQHAIVGAFSIGAFFFVLQTATMYIIMMDKEIGFICFAITILGGWVTRCYALRIYNKFQFLDTKVILFVLQRD
jgi:hypothetical protein